MKSEQPCSKTGHSLYDHEGILAARHVPGRDAVEITFDGRRLSEAKLREILRHHLESVPAGPQRRVLRLDGRACEAAAARLERRIEQIPGVRRATATYVGKVLCLTFEDIAAQPEGEILEQVKKTGAQVAPLKPEPATLWEKFRAGQLNEELSCAAGLLVMIAAAAADHLGARGTWISWSLYTAAYVLLGHYGVRSAVASLREGMLDVDLLMVLAALGAAWIGSPFEGALLLFLFSFSNVLQGYALDRTRRAIQSLLKLRPSQALKKTSSGTEMVPVESLRPGDLIIVRPGETVPVDGVIAEGESALDESSLTGESVPVAKGPGAQVFAGALNHSGALEVAVARAAADSTLSKMVELVAQAQAEKSGTQRFLEKAEQLYAAGVIIFTLLVLFTSWLGLGEEFGRAFYRAMTVMVVASPCAIIISTPATVLSAIAGAARRGILIKGGAHLERASRVQIAAFDKTGTLTRGRPELLEIATPEGLSALSTPLPEKARALLALGASLETKSEHPLALAMVQAATALGLPLEPAHSFQAEPGMGARGAVAGRHLLAGSEHFLRRAGAEGFEAIRLHAAGPLTQGRTSVWLAEEAGGRIRVLGVFLLADTLRPAARAALRQLKSLGLERTVMLTGDNASIAQAIAQQAGVDEFHAGLLPTDKVRLLREMKARGVTMMIGDGVNDAPALAASDLGVAMGAAGTDIAMDSADVVLMGDRIENLPHLVALARHARRILIQNLVFASAVIVCLVGAALGLNLPLPLGVVGHEGSTILVCLNGLRLLAWKPTEHFS